MRECPECKRVYYDETLNYCLEDGAELVYGPTDKDDPTAILSGEPLGEAPTRHQFVPDSGSAAGSYKDESLSTSSPFLTKNRGWLLILVPAFILGAVFFGYRYFDSASVKRIESIAIMPFANESGNPDIEYLSDGMTDSLITSLSRLPTISVKARSSVFRYKGKTTEAPVIGKELGVQAVLNGRVVQRGNDITLFVELIEAATEKVLWSENYNRSLANLVSLQSELAADVSQKLKAKLTPADERQVAKVDTENPEALQNYLNGRFQWNKRTPEGIKRSIEYFEKAIALDPKYARAYAGLANAYAVYFEDARPTSGASVPQAREAAMKALALDPDLPDAHASLGMILTVEYNFAEAEKELKRAIELDPNYPTSHHWYGLLLSSLGRHDAAISEIRRAIEIEPLSPLFANVYAGILFDARRYDEAWAQTDRLLELDPNTSAAYSLRGSINAIKGEYAQAVEAFSRSRELSGDSDASAPKMRKSFAEGGWRGYLYQGTQDPRTQNFPYTMARLYVLLGDKDEAFAQLNKAYEIRDFGLRRLKVDPRLDSIRDDPRYSEILRKVGFPE
jgi:TolB-like protein